MTAYNFAAGFVQLCAAVAITNDLGNWLGRQDANVTGRRQYCARYERRGRAIARARKQGRRP